MSIDDLNTPAWPFTQHTHHKCVCVCVRVRACMCLVCVCMIYARAWKLDTHACMVVVAVWKLNIFSLGNQLVSSAIREKKLHFHGYKSKNRKIYCAVFANVGINILEIWKHKTSTSQSTTPQMERGRHTEGDRDEESEIQTTTSHSTSKLQIPTWPKKK